MIANLELVLRGHSIAKMVLSSKVLNAANLDDARWTSEIAMNDARPVIYAGDASRSSPWEDLQRLGFIDLDESEEDKLIVTSFTDRVVPHDVSHWAEWSGIFWSEFSPPKLSASRQYRPGVISLDYQGAAKAMIQYREYEASFEQWSEDVVAFLAYEQMGRDALDVSWDGKQKSDLR